MSTKSTILLSTMNEHWYKEGWTGEIILEFSYQNRIFKMKEDAVEIHISEGSPLWIEIGKMLGWSSEVLEDAKRKFLL